MQKYWVSTAKHLLDYFLIVGSTRHIVYQIFTVADQNKKMVRIGLLIIRSDQRQIFVDEALLVIGYLQHGVRRGFNFRGHCRVIFLTTNEK